MSVEFARAKTRQNVCGPLMELFEAIKGRRSIRSYSEEGVTDEELNARAELNYSKRLNLCYGSTSMATSFLRMKLGVKGAL
jgi:hypothetical protein